MMMHEYERRLMLLTSIEANIRGLANRPGCEATAARMLDAIEEIERVRPAAWPACAWHLDEAAASLSTAAEEARNDAPGQ